MATSFGYGNRQYEWKIPYKAPPPNTYNPDKANDTIFHKGEQWKMGRPGVFIETNIKGQKMTQAQRNAVRLTKYTDKPMDMKVKEKIIKGDITGRSQTEKVNKEFGVKYVKMYPYDERNQKYEDPTIQSKGKLVARMEFEHKNEGKKYYKYKFKDVPPGPGKYYDYNNHHKHFFRQAKGKKIMKSYNNKGRFDLKYRQIPGPDNYQPTLKITNQKPCIYSFGYKFETKDKQNFPGAGTYNVRTSLKGAVPDNQVRSVKNKKMRKKVRRSPASTTRQTKTANTPSGRHRKSGRRSPQKDKMRQTFSTFGSAVKSGFHKKTCSPGPGMYNVIYKKRFKNKRKQYTSQTDRARTTKSTFGTDLRSTQRETKIINPTGPGHYPDLDSKISSEWQLKHSAKFLGRQKGWNKIKGNGVPAPGAYYNTFFNLKTNKGFLQGKGKRSKIQDGLEGFENCKDGPHHKYEIVNITQMGLKEKRGRKPINMHLGGKGPRSKVGDSKVPGAGSYQPKVSLTKSKSRKSTMAGKNTVKKYKTGVKQPSPVAYNPIEAFRHLKQKFSGPFVKSGVGFPKSHRTKYKKSAFIGRDTTKIRKKLGGNKFSFPTSERFPNIDEDDVEPGPGKYESKTYTVTAPAYLFKKPIEVEDINYDF